MLVWIVQREATDGAQQTLRLVSSGPIYVLALLQFLRVLYILGVCLLYNIVQQLQWAICPDLMLQQRACALHYSIVYMVILTFRCSLHKTCHNLTRIGVNSYLDF